MTDKHAVEWKRGVRWLLVLPLAVSAVSLSAQETETGRRTTTALGLFGFGVMGGVDLEGDGQVVAAVALDAGHLFTDRLRFRPSAEIGFTGGDNAYLANVEVVYRFIDDARRVVPYIGTGFGLRGRDECGSDPECPNIWMQFVLGFEIRLRDGIGWTLEYHPADLLRRQRFFIGLTTRRGW
jgi:hypothetical protein